MNNKKKCINIIAYIIVVILAVFYLATLVLGSKLDVSDEYKLYYVDGELSKWPGENGLDYYFGNTEIYDISKLEEYKKLLEEQKLYGDIITDDEEEADEVNEDSVESNRDSAIDKYFQKMLAAENNYVSEDADDNSTADKDEDKTIASALNIPYRYTKGFYSLHTGIYTNKGNEAALYYRFVTRVEKDIVLEVYGASYNTDTKVYANDEYIGTITAYNETEGAVTRLYSFTIVPTFSPQRARMIFSGSFRAKSSTGMWLSIEREVAVVSITIRCWASTSS